METKKTIDEQTSGLGASSSSSITFIGYSNPSRVHCPFCKGKFMFSDLENHFFTCHPGEMEFQTTVGKLIFSTYNNLIKTNNL